MLVAVSPAVSKTDHIFQLSLLLLAFSVSEPHRIIVCMKKQNVFSAQNAALSLFSVEIVCQVITVFAVPFFLSV